MTRPLYYSDMYRQAQIEALLSNRRILIAGYGREGKSSHALLQSFASGSVVDVACNDEEIFASLKHAEEAKVPYDLIIKSPGISTMKFEGRCNLDTITSQTDLFLQVFGKWIIFRIFHNIIYPLHIYHHLLNILPRLYHFLCRIKKGFK